MKNNLLIIILSVIFSVILWISVSLSNDFNSNLVLPIKVINVPEGYIATSTSSKLVNVKVKGVGWDLLNAAISSKNDFLVDADYQIKKNQFYNLSSFTDENSWLTSKLRILEISPDTISFAFEKIGYARKKIIPHLQLNFKDGYGLATDVTVSPESVDVSGPSKFVNQISDVPTELLKLNNLSDKNELAVQLKNIPEVSYMIQSARIFLDIQRIVEKDFEDIPVKVLDLPSDRDVVLLPNKINISLRGGIDVLGKLDNTKIEATVFYRDIVLDTLGSITPILQIPEFTSLVYAKPAQLKYIIKKFNK